ncbi:MAG: hypothetical protein JOY55_25650 [Mycobacterium sp.]|nr:hypothetical protein [Mycobacterium sp.]
MRRRRGRKKDDEADAADEAEDSEAEAADEDSDGEGGAADADDDETTEAPEDADQPAEVSAETGVESTAAEPESTAQEAPPVEDTVESSTGGLRNRRPTGKSSGVHRRRRARRGVAVED